MQNIEKERQERQYLNPRCCVAV